MEKFEKKETNENEEKEIKEYNFESIEKIKQALIEKDDFTEEEKKQIEAKIHDTEKQMSELLETLKREKESGRLDDKDNLHDVLLNAINKVREIDGKPLIKSEDLKVEAEKFAKSEIAKSAIIKIRRRELKRHFLIDLPWNFLRLALLTITLIIGINGIFGIFLFDKILDMVLFSLSFFVAEIFLRKTINLLFPKIQQKTMWLSNFFPPLIILTIEVVFGFFVIIEQIPGAYILIIVIYLIREYLIFIYLSSKFKKGKGNNNERKNNS